MDGGTAAAATASAPGAAAATTTPEEQWVQQELQHHAASYCRSVDLHTCVVTFNVGCKKPPAPFSALIDHANDGNAGGGSAEQGRASPPPVGLYVFALQEVDMGAQAMLAGETSARLPWIDAIASTVGADRSTAPNHVAPYVMLPPRQLVGLLLVVCLRRTLLPHLSNFAVATVATGTMDVMGNKGAVGMHLTLHGTRLCVLCCHLAAHQSDVGKRNADINAILNRMDFNAARRKERADSTRSAAAAEAAFPPLTPRHHDLVVVAGDLNYRVELPYEQAVALAESGAYDELLRFDQLTLEMRDAYSPWQGFHAFTPAFPPTYKYDAGTCRYDTSPKRRVPSYTDRVCVWARERGAAVGLDDFTALREVLSSDHKPVRARLRLPMRVAVPAERERVAAELRQKVARVGLAAASRCSCRVDVVADADANADAGGGAGTALDFGTMQFHHPARPRAVTVTNTGECAALVTVLRKRPSRTDMGGIWLRPAPVDLVVLPGDAQTVTVEAVCDPAAMPWLARWRPHSGNARLALQTSLLFEVRNGEAREVPCRATMRPSVFGNSLENLYLLGDAPCEAAYAREGGMPDLLRTLQPHIPKEIWALADVVFRHPYDRGLFLGAGVGGGIGGVGGAPSISVEAAAAAAAAEEADSDNEDASGGGAGSGAGDGDGNTEAARRALMAHLDRADPLLPLPPGTTAACASACLLILLQSLQERVVPAASYAAALAAGKEKGAAPFKVLKQLPALHATVFVYVMGLLNFLLRRPHSDANGLTPGLLAEVFSRVLLGPGSGAGAEDELARQAQARAGGVDQDLRRKLQDERDSALGFIECFLIPTPALLHAS